MIDCSPAYLRLFDVSEEYFRNLDKVWRDNPSRRSEWKCPESLFGPISRRSLIHIVPPSPRGRSGGTEEKR